MEPTRYVEVGTTVPAVSRRTPPLWLYLLRRIGVVGFIAVVPWCLWVAWQALSGLGSWIMLSIGMFLGYALTDLLSGLVHWASDRFGTVDTPLIGCALIEPFRTHHGHPNAITGEDIFELNGLNCFIATIVLGICVPVIGQWAPDAWAPGAYGCVCMMGWGIPLASQIHQWVHRDTPPTVIRIFQSWGLVIDASAHDAHHAHGAVDDYCIVSGWWNAPCRSIGLYRRLESVLVHRFGFQMTDDCAALGAQRLPRPRD